MYTFGNCTGHGDGRNEKDNYQTDLRMELFFAFDVSF